MNLIRRIARKLVMGKRSDSESYIRYLRSIGVQIGEDVTIYVPSKTLIDEQYPWMITIGNHVRITEGVKILTHDYAWSVGKRYTGGVFGASGVVEIGNNVFLGMNTIICRNVRIADNVIIGGGSVVTKDCLKAGVYAGNPARYITDLDSFCNKRKDLQATEAIELVRNYRRRFGKTPDKKCIEEYFLLYAHPENAKEHESIMNLCDNYDETFEYKKNNPSKYESYEDFIRSCFDENTIWE